VVVIARLSRMAGFVLSVLAVALATPSSAAASRTLHVKPGRTVLTGLKLHASATVSLRTRVRRCATARLEVRVGGRRDTLAVSGPAWGSRRRIRTASSGAVTLKAVAPRRCRAAVVDVSALAERAVTASTSSRPAAPARTPTPIATPAPTAVVTPAPTVPAPARTAVRRWGLIGNQTQRAAEVRAAGVTTKVVRLSWKDLEPAEGQVSSSYVSAKRGEIAALRAAGLEVVLDSGLQDVPQWLHSRPDSFLVNQYGEAYTTATDGDLGIDKGEANLIFNPALRTLAAGYLRRIGELFGSTAYAIRIGGGRWNELGYPPSTTSSHTNAYWAFDALAQQQSPVPGWKPGDPSPNGEARRFLAFYLGALVDFQQWQITAVRAGFAGPLIVLYPGWGIRPGQAAAAADDNLRGRTSAEINAEVPRGFDWAGQVAAIHDPLVWPSTTWIDAQFGSDSGDASQWRPPHYLRSLAGPAATLWGESTGQGTAAALRFAAGQAAKYGFSGLVWFREEELFAGGPYATLADYRATIAASETL
jgi:hypothetical protein